MEKTLPKNWVEAELGEILKLKNGFAFKSKDYSEEGIPLIRISNIQQGEVSTEKSIYVDKNAAAEDFIIEKGDVLVAMSGATTGKYGIFNEDIIVYQNQRVGNLKPLVPNLISRQFIYYLLGGLRKEIEDKAYGGAQPNISATLIETLKFNLPPLAEQQRIVAKLDELFKNLDTLKTSLNNIPKLLKNFKQTVLTQAVTGKLTKEWGKGKRLEKWEETTIGVLFKVKTGATPKRGNESYYEDGKIPWLKSGQVKNEFIYEADEFITELAVKETNAKVYPKDTLLVAMYGEGKTRGQVGWMKLEAASNQAIAALVNEEMEIKTKQYVYYYCLSQYLEIRKQAEGGNQPNLNLSKIKNWQINLPSKEEQTEIVNRVEQLFAKADAIEQQYQNLKIKIDSLPQAILVKSFKGELVEQLDRDGDAKDLLEDIKRFKEVVKANKTKPKKRKPKPKNIVIKPNPNFPLYSILLNYLKGMSEKELYILSDMSQHMFLTQLDKEFESGMIKYDDENKMLIKVIK